MAIDHGIVNVSLERITQLYDEGKFREAYSASLEEQEHQGDDPDERLIIALKSVAASSKIELGEYSVAYEILMEFAQRQIELIGPNQEDTLATQSKLALVLQQLRKSNDSKKLFDDVSKRVEKAGGHPLYLTTRLNLGTFMLGEGDYQEALDYLQTVLEDRMRVSGPDHPETLSIQTTQAKALMKLERFSEAFKIYTQVFNKRKEILGLNHLHTVTSQFYLAEIMVELKKPFEAFKTYNLVLVYYKDLLGDRHPATIRTRKTIDTFKLNLGPKKFRDWQTLCEQSIALERLHDFISSGDKNGVDDLLTDGLVDITQVTVQKENTTLHMAVHRNNIGIVESLLQHARQRLNPNKLVEFVDAKTTSVVGNTALHIAAINGSLNLMKALLRYGATYNIKNKWGETPVDKTNEPRIKGFLRLVDEVFKGAKRDDPGIISVLKALDKEERQVLTNAKNVQGYSLFQVPKSKSLSAELLELSV